jgi:Histone-binding protein RBBP4 or subunit C of CAF1 complex
MEGSVGKRGHSSVSNEPVANGKRGSDGKPATTVSEKGEECLEFEDPFGDEFEEEQLDDEIEQNFDDEDADLDDNEEVSDKSKPVKRTDNSATIDDNHAPKQVWRPGIDQIAEGEALEYDPSAYVMYHSLQTEWPCLSFDILKDDLGESRQRVRTPTLSFYQTFVIHYLFLNAFKYLLRSFL